MTETYKKIIESFDSGEIGVMAQSDDVSERLAAQGILSALNLYTILQINNEQVLEDARTD